MRKSMLCIAVASCVALQTGALSARRARLPTTNQDDPSACDSVSGNLVVNCGFETGFPVDPWTQSGDLTTTFFNMFGAHSGFIGAHLCASHHPGMLSQVLATTPGQVYTLSFWIRNTGQPSQFEVWWNGAQLSQITTLPDFSWTQFTYSSLPAPTGSTDLTLVYSNPPSFIDLDDFIVQ